MLFAEEDLQMMLERTGGAVHTVDGVELFCRVKALPVEPDEFGRVMTERQELTHIPGDTFQRRVRHDTVVDGTTWSIISVHDKLSGFTVWTLEREVG